MTDPAERDLAEREAAIHFVSDVLCAADNPEAAADLLLKRDTEKLVSMFTAGVAQELRIDTLKRALRDALGLAVRWRDVTEDTLGRLTSDGSAELDFLGDEMNRLRALIVEIPSAACVVRLGGDSYFVDTSHACGLLESDPVHHMTERQHRRGLGHAYSEGNRS